MLVNLFLLVLELIYLLFRLVLTFLPMDDSISISHLLVNLFFFLGLLLANLKVTFLFMMRDLRRLGTIYHHFELNNIFFRHLLNKMEDFLSLIHIIVLLNSNNPLSMSVLIYCYNINTY